LQAQDVRDFMSDRLESGLSARTVKHLRATLNQAINDDLIQRNVAKKVKPPEVQPRALDVYSPRKRGLCLMPPAATVSKPCSRRRWLWDSAWASVSACNGRMWTWSGAC
jgi:hypothetical protein